MSMSCRSCLISEFFTFSQILIYTNKRIDTNGAFENIQSKERIRAKSSKNALSYGDALFTVALNYITFSAFGLPKTNKLE